MKSLSLFLEPKNFKDAMTGPEAPLWKPVADEEIASHYKNDTWTLAPLPAGAICIPSGWDFRVKTDKLGQPSRRKARFFLQGYAQVKGLDYLDSFAPVVRLDSFRVIIAIAAGRDLEIIQIDVKTAFLNGRVDEEIYIAQPEGYIVPGHETDVCRLNKSIYGICQAGRIWYKTLHDALLEFGFVQSTADPCVYHYFTKDIFVILASWVDDGFLTGNSISFMRSIISFLNKKFEITAVPAELFVGIVITRDRLHKKIFLSIPQFIEKMLIKFNSVNAHPVSQPVLKGTPRLSKASSPIDQVGRDSMSAIPYRELLGSISYATCTVRPDLAFIVNQLAQFCQNPGPEHWNAGIRVLKYLAGTRNHGLCFDGNMPDWSVLDGYSDADLGGDPETRRSTSGYTFRLSGGAISWSSRRQSIVALSTMQAEYIAASDWSREAVWLRTLLQDLGSAQTGPTLLQCDNESAINLAYNPLAHKGSKHIDLRHHYIRELVEAKVVRIKHVNSKAQLADMLTKAVDAGTFSVCVRGLGVGPVPIVGI